MKKPDWWHWPPLRLKGLHTIRSRITKLMKKYIPYAIALLILAAFIVWRMSGPDDTKEQRAQWEKEREVYHQAIGQKDAQIIGLNQGIQAERNKRNDTIAYFTLEVTKRDRRIAQMKKRNESIDFSRYTDVQLDSLRTRYYVLPAH